MLIEFTVGNFRSVREPVTLSLIATALDSKDPRLGTENVFPVGKNLTLLRSAVIYGANASGKSNLIKAFQFMVRLVRDSARESVSDEPIPVEPFLLREDMRNQPCSFEVVFLKDSVQYRYGFEVTHERVVKEWLFHTPSSREAVLFTRDEEGINIPSHAHFKFKKDARGLESRTRDNALFLSVVAQFNGELATSLQQWFAKQCQILNRASEQDNLSLTQKCIQEEELRPIIETLLPDLGLDITGLSVKENPSLPSVMSNGPAKSADILHIFDEFTNRIQKKMDTLAKGQLISQLHTRHTIRDKRGLAIRDEEFPLSTMESEGTQRIIALLGPLLTALALGTVVFIDEIDARLHPLITQAFVRLFHSEETNPNNAQLICATHDTNLLDAKLFRRDQVFFTEKLDDATTLYSLADFKVSKGTGEDGKPQTVRSDASYERNYLLGRYGAVPTLGDLYHLFAVEVPEAEARQAEREAEAVPVG